MNGDTGILPQYSVPHIEISEIINPEEIYINIKVGDLPGLIEKLNGLKDGDKVDLVKYGPNRKIWVRFTTDDPQKSKTLGG